MTSSNSAGNAEAVVTSERSLLLSRAGAGLALAMLAGLAIETHLASAQPAIGNARWCVTLPFGGMMQCSYHSLDECMTYARGVSNQSSVNPWYEGPPPKRKRLKRTSR